MMLMNLAFVKSSLSDYSIIAWKSNGLGKCEDVTFCNHFVFVGLYHVWEIYDLSYSMIHHYWIYEEKKNGPLLVNAL